MPINAHAHFAKNWESSVSCACPPLPQYYVKVLYKNNGMAPFVFGQPLCQWEHYNPARMGLSQ